MPPTFISLSNIATGGSTEFTPPTEFCGELLEGCLCGIYPRDSAWIPEEWKLSLGFGHEELCMLLVQSEHDPIVLLHIRDCCTLQQQHAHLKNALNSQKCRPDPCLTYHKLTLKVNFKVPLELRILLCGFQMDSETITEVFNQVKDSRTWDKQVSFCVNVNLLNFPLPRMYANSHWVTVCDTNYRCH